MRAKWFTVLRFALVVVWGLLLVGCAPTPSQESSSPEEMAVGSCPAAGPGTQRLVNEEHGYCLLYPTGHEVMYPNEDETALVVGSLMDVEHPRVYVKVTGAESRSARQVADEMEAQLSPGFDTERTNLSLNAEEAVMLDRLPGQDMNRQVFVVHAGRLYALTFVPVGEDYGDISIQTEAFYRMVVDSFRFLP